MLSGKRFVVTGAAGTLGQAVAACAKNHGAEVLGLDIVAETTNPNLSSYHQVDLTDREATQACFKQLGSFHALANVAGGFAMGTESWAADDEQWDWMFRINVSTVRNTVMAAVNTLKSTRGSIVNIGAFGALSGEAGMGAYCSAKSTVMRLTESLAAELKAEGINVNAVLPSIIDTVPNREAMPEADFASWVSPDSLAEVICFLASDRASAINSALLPVKGLV